MGIGMLSFQNSGQGKVGMAHVYLVQGVMSAISAGMLIYAATVEMIAGDFVFGDVEGHSHGHGPEQHSDDDNEDVEEAAMAESGSGGKASKIKKKILAVVSLLAGVGGMVLVGLAE
ncbi:hypothetical protein BDQ17DRAFT_1353899 [Cyathus striatus]|nr:hypothetical protein BDQ17DRAFT_1353899 [Cyathus striatus]